MASTPMAAAACIHVNTGQGAAQGFRSCCKVTGDHLWRQRQERRGGAVRIDVTNLVQL